MQARQKGGKKREYWDLRLETKPCRLLECIENEAHLNSMEEDYSTIERNREGKSGELKKRGQERSG